MRWQGREALPYCNVMLGDAVNAKRAAGQARENVEIIDVATLHAPHPAAEGWTTYSDHLPPMHPLDGLTGLRLHRALTAVVAVGAVAGAAAHVVMLLRAAPPQAAPAPAEAAAEGTPAA